MSSKQTKSIRLQMVISPGEVAEIDDWRREQPVLPSRSEAIRQLIALGLEAARERQKAKP